MSRPRSVSWLRSHPVSLRPYQRAHWSRLVGHFETHLEGGPSAFGYEAPMGSGKTTTVKAIAAALLSEGKARLVVIAAPLDAIVQAWAVRGAWSHEPGGYLQLPSPPQDFGDLPRPSTAQLSDPRWWASATGCWVTTRQAMCTSAAREAMEKSRVSLRDVLVVGDEGHHHGDGTEAGKFFAALRKRGAATLLVSGTPWHGSGSIFTSDTQVVRLSAAAYAQEIDPSTGHAYAPSQWRVERYIVPEVVTDDVRLAYEPDRPISEAATWIERDVRGMCRAAAERWAAIGCPRTVINVPGAKLWKTRIVAELQRVAPGVLGRPAVVVNLIGDMSNEDRAAAQARLAVDGAAGVYDHPERVDVVVSCARMDEGTDWPPCSHVFNIRIPSSPLRILQRWARASRGKRKIAGYPAAWVDTQTMVFFVPTLTGDDARERAYKQHREQAVLLAAYLADYEAASRWIDPRCFAAQDAAARRAEGRKLPKGARLAYATNAVGGDDGDRRGGTAIERACATAEIVKRIQKHGPDGAVKIAELDAELARVMPDVSEPARKAALLSLYRTGEVADAVTAALGRANRATAEGKPALRVREELQAELDAIVEKFGHFDVSVPDELNVCAAKFTALEADDVAEYARQSGVPSWDHIRHDREALEAFAREKAERHRNGANSYPTSATSAEWGTLDSALGRLGSSLSKARGRKFIIDEVTSFYDSNGYMPRHDSVDDYEVRLAKTVSSMRGRSSAFAALPRPDRSDAMRRGRGLTQFGEMAEIITLLGVGWRATSSGRIRLGMESSNLLDRLLRLIKTAPRQTRGLAFTYDKCMIYSLPTANAEIEADCWRFTLAGETAPDPRSWSELLASGDHRRIVGAKRVAFLDWKDSRLRGGTRWIDLRVGTGPKCPPAVRRPWTPPAPAEPADGT